MCWERERIIQIKVYSRKLNFICGLNVGNKIKKEWPLNEHRSNGLYDNSFQTTLSSFLARRFKLSTFLGDK
jgi:hypothetical protein